jgi:2-methylisocitrate lyase-like PEP mutase family enzyme
LAEIGVVRISVGALLSRAALGVVMRAAAEMQEHGTFGWVEQTPLTREVSGFMAGPA